MVAETYSALITVQGHRPVLPHNRIWGLHYYAMGVTHTQSSTQLVLLTSSIKSTSLKYMPVMGARVRCIRWWIFVTRAETTRSRSVQLRAVVAEV